MAEGDTPPITSTAFSFEVIDRVQELDGATLPEVVDQFDKPKSTVYDHLTTLVNLGYIVKEGRSYRVSVRFLNLGGLARARSELFQVAEDEVKRLARETGEHANLMVESNGLGVFLMKEKGQESVRLDTYEGMEVHLHTTALGKAILAELPEAKRTEVFSKHGLPSVTENTITDRAELREELAAVRDRGYALDDEERIGGIRCVATSITTDSGVAGAVSVSAPESRMSGEKFTEELPARIQSTANIIEVNLQHA